MPTDRELLKGAHSGGVQGVGLTDAIAAVNQAHTRTHHFPKTGTENAATAVAETVGCVINRKALIKTIKYCPATAVAADNTDYIKLIVYKRTSAGASQTTLGSWNSATAAQGAITQWAPASLSLVANADIVVAAGSIITFEITKTGAGKVAPVGTISVDAEEI